MVLHMMVDTATLHLRLRRVAADLRDEGRLVIFERVLSSPKLVSKGPASAWATLRSPSDFTLTNTGEEAIASSKPGHAFRCESSERGVNSMELV